ncbi:NAD(P)-binding protein [Paramyrothecium foliicola]|nr:NAD(P)-binding protein [Paramyrothecium foliicola]
MSGLITFAIRNYKNISPDEVPRSEKALRFGILEAANVAPMAFITPAKTHPDVIVHIVAERDRTKAETFAKKNGIPNVANSCQVNSLHFEWAAKAICAGKHVLVEKPLTANAKEAVVLFAMPELSRPGAPILMAQMELPTWATNDDDVYFNYTLAGGAIMSLGTYTFAALRELIDAEPEECTSCENKAFTEGKQTGCDYQFEAKFQFPNGVIGESAANLKGGIVYIPDVITVTTKEEPLKDERLELFEKLKPNLQILKSQDIAFRCFNAPGILHRIDIVDNYIVKSRSDGKIIKSKSKKQESLKAYTFREAGGQWADLPGDSNWMTYRHLLEQFVNKVKGRQPQAWINADWSMNQMKMIDMAYEKSGLGPRKSSK